MTTHVVADWTATAAGGKMKVKLEMRAELEMRVRMELKRRRQEYSLNLYRERQVRRRSIEDHAVAGEATPRKERVRRMERMQRKMERMQRRMKTTKMPADSRNGRLCVCVYECECGFRPEPACGCGQKYER